MTPQEYIDAGYYQVSRDNHEIARLPEGKTGKQALLDAELADKMKYSQVEFNRRYWEREVRHRVEAMTEPAATDHYLRVFAREAGLVIQLKDGEFALFRRLGGRTAR